MEIPNALSFEWVPARNPDEHICKFIGVMKDDGSPVIYVGKFEYHTELSLAIGADWKIPFAAGTVTKRGEVISWSSAAYDFSTPETVRAPIEKLMADNKAVIAENW